MQCSAHLPRLHQYTVSHQPKHIPRVHVRANGTRELPQASPLLMLRFSYFYLIFFSYFSLLKQIEHTYTREILNPMDTNILLSHGAGKMEQADLSWNTKCTSKRVFGHDLKEVTYLRTEKARI